MVQTALEGALILTNLVDCGVAASTAPAPCNLAFDADISEY